MKVSKTFDYIEFEEGDKAVRLSYEEVLFIDYQRFSGGEEQHVNISYEVFNSFLQMINKASNDLQSENEQMINDLFKKK